MKWFWAVAARVAPVLKAYALPVIVIAVIGAATWLYLQGREHANDACDAEQAAAVQRAYEQGYRIAEENAQFEREVVTIVREVQSDTPVDDSGCRLTDDGLRNLNDFLGTP